MNLRQIPRDIIAPRPTPEPASAPDSQARPADSGAFENALRLNRQVRADASPGEPADSAGVESGESSEDAQKQPVQTAPESLDSFDQPEPDAAGSDDSSQRDETSGTVADEPSVESVATAVSGPDQETADGTFVRNAEAASLSVGVRDPSSVIAPTPQQPSFPTSESAPENATPVDSTPETPLASVIPLRSSLERSHRGVFRRVDRAHLPPSVSRTENAPPAESSGELQPLQSLLPPARSEAQAPDVPSLRFPAQVDFAVDSTLTRSEPLTGQIPDLQPVVPEISESEVNPELPTPLPSLLALDSGSGAGARTRGGTPDDAGEALPAQPAASLFPTPEPEMTLLFPDSSEVQITSTESTLAGGVTGVPRSEGLEPLPSLLRGVVEVAPLSQRTVKLDAAVPAGPVSARPAAPAPDASGDVDSTSETRPAMNVAPASAFDAVQNSVTDQETLTGETSTDAVGTAALSQSLMVNSAIPSVARSESSESSMDDTGRRSGPATSVPFARSGVLPDTVDTVIAAAVQQPNAAFELQRGTSPDLSDASVDSAGSAALDDILPADSDRATAAIPDVVNGSEIAAAGVGPAGRVEPGQAAPVADPDRASMVNDEGQVLVELSETVSTIRRAISGDGHIKVRLNPPELGAMQIEVRQIDAGITVRLEVETEAAQKALLESLGDLRQSLRQQRAGVEQIDVVLIERSQEPLRGSLEDSRRDADRERSFEEQNRRQEQERRNRQQRQSPRPDEETSSEAA